MASFAKAAIDDSQQLRKSVARTTYDTSTNSFREETCRCP
jgi:hypothetical protein